MIPHRARRLLGIVLVSAALAACSTSRNGSPSSPSADLAPGPVTSGVNVEPGSEQDLMVNVGRRIFFTENSAVLDETAKVTLDKQAAWLAQYPQWKVKLQGFADDPGGDTQNVAISKKRAEAAMQYLVSKGVAADRLFAKGYGRDRLIQDCADLSCKAQNRRVITNPQDAPET